MKEMLLNKYFPVHNCGFISLVDCMGSDQSIVRAARVSYGAGTKSLNEDKHLLRYLLRHKHTSPFEMAEAIFHVKMPIFVARQHIRHRTASLNEVSGRYSILPTEFYTPKKENFCIQASNNKQGRAEVTSEEFYNQSVEKWSDQRKLASENYEWLLENDAARELARIDLPLSLMTEFYWKIDLHNLFHFLKLRCDSHAQFEIREYANTMAGIVKELFPLSFEAFEDYSLNARNVSAAELETLQELLVGPGILEVLTTLIHENQNLSKREKDEFLSKLKFQKKQDFTLDLNSAKDANYFYEIAQLAVPKIDKNKEK